MMRGKIAAFAAVVVLNACASAKPQEQLTADALYAKAMSELVAKKYSDATTDFERFSLEYPSHTKAQEARFHMAEAYLGKKEYVTAAAEFTRLATDYPSGAFADDSRFKVCEAYHKLSPMVQLDQTYTLSAIEHCEALITYYPASEFVPRAQSIEKELKEKLAEKQYLAGQYYFNRRAYDSALIYFESTVKNFPETPAAPRALFRTVQTYQKLNYKEEAAAARERLLKEYPTSAEAKEVQNLSVANTT
jgi:outer membrane protein assembly factor BamD